MQSHFHVPPKASKKRFLKKIIFSSGIVGLVGLVGAFTKTYRSQEAAISRETFRRYLTSH